MRRMLKDAFETQEPKPNWNVQWNTKVMPDKRNT